MKKRGVTAKRMWY